MEGDRASSQPLVVDPTNDEQNQAGEDLLFENRNSESPDHYGVNDGVSGSGYLELNNTLPWDGLPTVDESEDSEVFISGDDRLGVSVDEPNLETHLWMMHLMKLWICHWCLQGRPVFQPKHFLHHNLVL